MTDQSATGALRSLVEWAHRNKGDQQCSLVLIDNLGSAARCGVEFQQDLRWLLLRGSARRVWPIATLSASAAHDMAGWLHFFRTRAFGRIENPQAAALLGGTRDANLEALEAGSQFSILEGRHWLKFHSVP